ncbi:deoxyribonuclease V [Candidatus Poribacteria bacterium]
MKYLELHSWDLQYSEAVKVQRELKDRLILKAPRMDLRLVAGADVSYSKGSDVFFSSVVVFEMPDMKIVEESTAKGRVDFPYIPGLLSFREAPVLIKAFEGLKNIPDMIIFDGQGIAHPRGIGLASHMGLVLDCSSIGCAKKILVGDHDPVGNEVGDYSPLVFQDNVVGAALRTRKNVKPVFISPGHKMDMPSAVETVMKTCRGYKLPEPTRQAHLSVNRFRASHQIT